MKHFHASLLCLAVVFATPAPAQHVVFHDGFENGLSGWTATGLWNLEDSADTCGALAAPFVEGNKAAWFGASATCNFNIGTTWGELKTIGWVTLPDAPSISLRFWSWSESEYCWGPWPDAPQWDVHWVEIEAQNGPNQGFRQDLCSWNGPAWLLLPWHERRIDLSAYRGADVRVSFGFSSGDADGNTGLGWLVDDVSLIAEPGERVCPSAGLNSGCPCAQLTVPVAGGCRNSTGQSATLISDGTVSVAADTLTFTAAHMPPGTTPTLVQGSAIIAPAAFGDGLRCIGGMQLRVGRQIGSNGTTTWPAPASPPVSVSGFVPPSGGTRYYQVVYRNAASFCMPETFNLTDAQRIVWSP